MPFDFQIPVLISSEFELDLPYAKVKRDRIHTQSGELDYYYWSGGDFVVVFPLCPSGVVYIQLYKHGAKEVVTEFPAGMIDEGEDPDHAANRELYEETGLEASKLVHLKSCWVSAGKSDTKAHFYLAVCDSDVHSGYVAEPGIKILTIKLEELEPKVATLFSDSNSTALCAMGISWLRNNLQ